MLKWEAPDLSRIFAAPIDQHAADLLSDAIFRHLYLQSDKLIRLKACKMNDILIVMLVGFTTGITTVLFGFGGGFIVVPLVYHLIIRQPPLAEYAMHIAVATSTAVMIFNAGWASFQSWRAGSLSASTLFPLLGFIAIGAVVGSMLSGLITDGSIRTFFIIYILVTLADCLIRKGFLIRPVRRKISGLTAGFGGIFIGCVAALLGVGGSVMTVPLLRRHGYEMQDCVSAANPLSLPVALCGTVAYSINGIHSVQASGYTGFVSVKILLLLIITGFSGILFTRRYVPSVSDILHARIYVVLLLTVLVAIML